MNGTWKNTESKWKQLYYHIIGYVNIFGKWFERHHSLIYTFWQKMMLVFGQTVERNLISIFSITCAGQDFTIPALSITYLDIGLEHLLNFSYHGPHLVFKVPACLGRISTNWFAIDRGDDIRKRMVIEIQIRLQFSPLPVRRVKW